LSTEPLEFVRIFADCFRVLFDADVQSIEKFADFSRRLGSNTHADVYAISLLGKDYNILGYTQDQVIHSQEKKAKAREI